MGSVGAVSSSDALDAAFDAGRDPAPDIVVWSIYDDNGKDARPDDNPFKIQKPKLSSCARNRFRSFCWSVKDWSLTFSTLRLNKDRVRLGLLIWLHVKSKRVKIEKSTTKIWGFRENQNVELNDGDSSSFLTKKSSVRFKGISPENGAFISLFCFS